jgi:hypothetical protein
MSRGSGHYGEFCMAGNIRSNLSRTMLRTVGTYGLIEQGDRIMVAVSGGKDSYTMLDLLWAARRKAPVGFELIAYHLDQSQPGYDGAPLAGWLEESGIPFELGREDTFSAVMAEAGDDEDATYCRLCSRLRRGIMYKAAARLECNKIALGHHRDDALETLLLNMFYAGRLQAMPASYVTNDEQFRGGAAAGNPGKGDPGSPPGHARLPQKRPPQPPAGSRGGRGLGEYGSQLPAATLILRHYDPAFAS